MRVFFSLFLLITCLPISSADTSAEDLLQKKLRTKLLRTPGTLTGESMCWHAAFGMSAFMDEYRATNDTAYLDAAIQYYDALINKMHESPDGYKGWVGPFIYDDNYICDVHIGDAILINHMLDFCETVLLHENKDIRQKYNTKAFSYLELAKKHLIEKWERRGTWHVDGSYGAYSSWNKYLTADNLNEWRVLPAVKSNITLPFNKQNSMGIACLRIYRITGEKQYRDKALKIFNFMKSRMCLFQDHYVWNYWEPFGKWDIDPDSSNKLRHWVNVHPYRNYQAGEIHDIVEAYHSGLTFTQQDLEHIINTNLKVMWNGDKTNPKWRNSNYAIEMAAWGKIRITKTPGGESPNLAGTLWTGLRDFDPTIRELMGRKIKTPISFQRKYSNLPVTEFHRPFHSSRYFTMVAVLPSVSSKGDAPVFVSQTRIAGNIKIEIYSKDGERKITNVFLNNKKDPAGLLIYHWDNKDVLPGEYRARWTLKDEYREFPIMVK